MQPVFTSGILDRIAAADALVAFDFDGTLAPIVADPAQAAMRAATRRLLAEAARLYPCVVISGRPEEDVTRLLGGVTVWYVIGNRALQPKDAVERLAREVASWRPALQQELARYDGVSFEDKGVSLAIHYRNARERDSARAAIAESARRLTAARVVEGKEVVNLLPQQAPGKGAALERIRGQLCCREALYVGDDRTDEDVFALPGVTGVRVGAPVETTAAQYFLRDQAEVDELLQTLVSLRPQRTVRPEFAGRRVWGL